MGCLRFTMTINLKINVITQLLLETIWLLKLDFLKSQQNWLLPSSFSNFKVHTKFTVQYKKRLLLYRTNIKQFTILYQGSNYLKILNFEGSKPT